MTRGKETSRRFLYVLVGCLVWTLMSALSAISPSESLAARLFMLHYAAISVTAVFMLQFSLRYVDQVRNLMPPAVLLFAIPLFVSLVIAVAPDNFFSTPRFVRAEPLLLIDTYEPRWAFWLNALYAYMLIGTSYALIFAAMFRVRAPYTGQVVLFVAGATLLFGVNLVTRADLFGLRLPRLDWSGATMSVACLLWYVAVFNYRFLDVMPLARDVLIETMRDAVMVLDPLGRVVDANPAMQAFLGEPLMIGEPVENVLPAVLLPHITAHAESDVIAEVEMPFANQVRRLDLRVSALGDDSGEVIGRLLVLQDVTERATMIRDLNAYARVVAHDLKNPIGVMSNYAVLLEKICADAPNEVREYIAAIRTTCERTGTIISELLLMASSRGQEPQMEQIDMASLVAEVQKRLDAMITASGAEVVVATIWPAAMGKQSWVEEVWANYLSNAIKYGGRPPRIELGAGFDQSGAPRFFVRDNGAGFAEHERAKLFQEFQRLAPQLAEGHGLGLSIARRLVERLGGKVGAESIPGKGSTFWFTLPAPESPPRETVDL